MHSSYRTSVIVTSDRASSGAYEDKAGPAAVEWLTAMGFTLRGPAVIVSDDAARLIAALDFAVDDHDLIVVSGGTGISPRDITPQTLDRYADYPVPGIGEHLRRESFQYSTNAYLSRCGAWVRAGTLILALPGNPKAVVEQLGIVQDLLKPALDAVKGVCQHRHRTKSEEAHDQLR
jgi:molybdenum cofactor synthesis domain-containing protein